MPTRYQPIPIWIAYGGQVRDPAIITAFQRPSLARQIVCMNLTMILTEDGHFDLSAAQMDQQALLAVSAVNLRELVAPGQYDEFFRELALRIPPLTDESSTQAFTVWPNLQLLSFEHRAITPYDYIPMRGIVWTMSAAPNLQHLVLVSPIVSVEPTILPTGIRALRLQPSDKLASNILQNNVAATNLRSLTLDARYMPIPNHEHPDHQPMVDVLIASASSLTNLREFHVRGFGPARILADAVAKIVAIPSLRTISLRILGSGDVRREAGLLSRVLDAATLGLRTLGLVCMTSPTERRGPLPSFVLDVLAKAKLPCLRKIIYVARGTDYNSLVPAAPLETRSNVKKLKYACTQRRVKLEVIEMSGYAWPEHILS